MWWRSQSVSNIANLLLAGLAILTNVSAQAIPVDKGELRTGQSVEAAVSPGETHQYRVALKSGDVLIAQASQERVDVTLAVTDASGAELQRVDSIQPGGTEEIRAKAAGEGPVYLRVIAETPRVTGGRYKLQLAIRNLATPQDESYLEGLRLFLSGKAKPRGQVNDPAQLEQLRQAGENFRSAGDLRMVAVTLRATGEVERFLNKFDDSARDAAEAIAIFTKLDVPAGKAEALCVLGVANGISGKLKESAEAFREAADIYARIGAVKAEGTAISNLGTTVMQMGRNEEARTYLERGVALDREMANEAGLSVSLANLGHILMNLGQTETALLPLQEAAGIAQRLKLRYNEGSILNTLCHANYRLSRFELARSLCQQGLAINREIKEQNGEAISLFFLSTIEFDTGRYREAMELQEQTLAVYRALDNRPATVMALNGLAGTYNALGRLEQAISTATTAVEMAKEADLGLFQGAAMKQMGIAWAAVGQYERAMDAYQEALRLQRKAVARGEESETLHKLSELCLLLDQPGRAVEYGEQALAASTEAGELRAQAASWSVLGRAQLAHNQPAKALASFERAWKLRSETGERATAGEARQYIGAALGAMNRFEEASAAFSESVATADAVGNAAGSASALSDWARVELRRGRLTEARNLIERSLRQYEETRASIYNPTTRATYFSSVHEAHQIHVSVLMQLHRRNPREGFAEKAFEAAERARARSLLELLTERGEAIREGVRPELLERERTLAQQINAAAKTLSELPRATPEDRQRAEQTARHLEELRRQYEQSQTDLRRASPRYAAATQPELFTIGQIQQQLDSDTLLLEYFLGPDRSFFWAVGGQSLSVYEAPGEAELTALANRLYKAVTARARRDPAANPDTEVLKTSGLLMRALLLPAARQLEGKRLAIVADGALQLVPFAMLPTPGRPRQPLIAGHEIVSLPSASALAVQRRELADRTKPSKLAAVFADPVFSGLDERLHGASAKRQDAPAALEPASTRILQHLQTAASGVPQIARLPFTKAEAEQIVSLGESQDVLAVTGFRATRAAALSGQLNDYRYLHFATHGFLDSERPELSALVLSLVDENGNSQDGFLRAYEVFNMKLSADLVVLSACQTGLGRDVKGEGLMGLTRGFLYAGASGVLVSLWSINDQATSELVTELYRRMIRDHLRPAAALRAAQLTVWKNRKWQAPYYWAAFVLNGEWR